MYLPIWLWIPYRIGKAFLSTLRLLVNVRVMRALPWRYIVRLPFRNIWIAMASIGLAAGVVGLVGTLLFPPDIGFHFYLPGFLILLAALVSSWVRAIIQRRRLRHG